MTEPHADTARGGGPAPARPAPAGAGLPEALAPIADTPRIRTGYPVLLRPEGADGPAVEPLGDALAGLVARFAPGEGQHGVLKDNLLRLERALVDAAAGWDGPRDARGAVAEAGVAVLEELALPEDPAAKLREGLDRLHDEIPEGALLAPYRRSTALVLFAHAARRRLLPARRRLLEEVRGLRRRLLDRIAAEEAASAPPEAVRDALGQAGADLDLDELARIAGGLRGTVLMAPERLERLRATAARLGELLDGRPAPVAVVAAAPGGPAAGAESADVRVVRVDDPIAGARAAFDRAFEEAVPFVAAIRTARLELADAWRAEVHGRALARLRWTDLDEDEAVLLPAVAAWVTDPARVGDALLEAAARPLHFLFELAPARRAGGDADHLFRVEPVLAALAVRHATVAQTTPARPEHMAAALEAALAAVRPSFLLVATGWLPDGSAPPVGAWLAASAAVDARAHPLFRYVPARGDGWADCADVEGNPDPEADWPAEGADNGTPARPFTFADYALLDPVHAARFRPLREGDDGMPVADWLAAGGPPDARPTVRVRAGGAVEERVVAPALVFACRDRLRTWHLLRELGGVRNGWAERAAEAARAEERAAAEAEIERLRAEHAEEVERVRAEAAGEAMERLARIIVDADLSALPAAGAAARPAAAPAAPAPAAETPGGEPAAPEPADDEDDDLVLDDPWIDSALCTSCNDCIQLNPKLFVYNENKQATIGDPDAGTFAELVMAAEKCPSRCIHPGRPRNPDEPDLEELVARAAKFR